MASPFAGKSRAELLELARTYHWWHSIDLGGFVTPGAVGRAPLIERAFAEVDFAGKKVLDVGCWDGLWSFEAEKRGAAEVYSTDYVSLRAWSEQSSYQLAHAILGSRARYFPNLSVYDIEKVGVSDFDVVVYCGVYYHLSDPLRAFTALRNVIKEGGLMIVEGPVLDGSTRPYADFYGRRWFAGDPTNWWIPSMECLREWLDCTFFDVKAEFSSKAALGPPAAPSPAPAPPAPAGRLQRLRRALAAALREEEIPAATPAAEEGQDRISLVARATSVAERLAARARVPGLASLRPGHDADGEAIASFCDAAADYHRAAPWQDVRHDRALRLDCPALRNEPLFLMVLGQATAERGLVIHFQRPGFVMVTQGWLLGEQLTWAPLHALLYSRAEQMPAGEADVLARHGGALPDGTYPLAVFNDGHGATDRAPGTTLRRPRRAELQLLEACLRAVPRFVERQTGLGGAAEDMAVKAGGSEVPVTVAWVVEGERQL